MERERETPPAAGRAALEAVARRAAAGRLACPYCQDALRAAWPAPDRLQLRCPTCGFTEAPDVAGAAGGSGDGAGRV